MDKNEIYITLLFLIIGAFLGGFFTFAGVLLDNQYSKEAIESELVIMDLHIESEKNISKSLIFNNLTIDSDAPNLNISRLFISISTVSSAYSKYPLKIRSSKIIYNNEDSGNQISQKLLQGENDPYVLSDLEQFKHSTVDITIKNTTNILIGFSAINFNTSSVYPLKENIISFDSIIVSRGNGNLTGTVEIYYYDPSSKKEKKIIDDVFLIVIDNGDIDYIYPLKEYVTIKGFKIGESWYMYQRWFLKRFLIIDKSN